MTISTFLSGFTLSVNGLNAPIKSGQMDTKQDPYICYLQDTHFTSKDTHTESEGMEKRYFMKMETKGKVGYQSLYQIK